MSFDEMKTQILTCSSADIGTAAEIIGHSGVVAMPTETVYGLAANALDEEAVKKIFEAKGRPADNPLIVHIADIDDIFGLAVNIPETALAVARSFWPAPLTLVLEKSDSVPLITSGGLDTVGIRMPDCKAALELIGACKVPLAAPSANRSGKPSPTNANDVFEDMNGRIPAIIDGGECRVGVESTVICFENDGDIRILRPGFVTPEELEPFCRRVVVDKHVLKELEPTARAASPGMKYKHYSPNAEVYLVEGSADAFLSYAKKNGRNGDYLLMNESEKNSTDIPALFYGTDSEENAHYLFERLREFDRIGAKRVFAMAPSKSGVGLAVYNRLIRAAGFKVVILE